MLEALWPTPSVWLAITHLGSAGLILPVMAVAATSLWLSRQRAAVVRWLLMLALAIAITLATKALFMGWGIGIACLDFTGVSGHAVLATSIFPMLGACFPLNQSRRFVLAGACIGLLLGGGVAISRVVVGAHSVSEVVAAWLIGLAVSGVALSALKDAGPRSWLARLAPLGLLLAFGALPLHVLPTHDWEIKFALHLSGREAPYVRQDLHSAAGLGKSRSCWSALLGGGLEDGVVRDGQ